MIDSRLQQQSSLVAHRSLGLKPPGNASMLKRRVEGRIRWRNVVSVVQQACKELATGEKEQEAVTAQAEPLALKQAGVKRIQTKRTWQDGLSIAPRKQASAVTRGGRLLLQHPPADSDSSSDTRPRVEHSPPPSSVPINLQQVHQVQRSREHRLSAVQLK